MNGNVSSKSFSIFIICIFCINYLPMFLCNYNNITLLRKKVDTFEAITIGRGLLAIGDSLTKGLVTGEKIHPYIYEIQNQINRHHNGRNISIVLHGHPGASSATIKNDLRSRFTSRMKEFAFVMILSGTNDLTCQRNGTTSSFNTDSIARTIIDMHRYAHTFGSPHRPVYTIAATIPQSDRKRCAEPINNKLREYARNCSNLIYMLDLERLLNQSDSQQAAKLWKLDRVHFTVAGSNLLGRLFYHAMLNFSYDLWQRGYLQRIEEDNDYANSWSNISLPSNPHPHSSNHRRHDSHDKGASNHSYVLLNHSNNCSVV